MKGNFIEKCCPVCGKYFVDNSINHSRNACSNSCRHEFYSINQDKDKRLDRLIRIRTTTLRLKGTILTDAEIEEVREKLIVGVCQICGKKKDLRHLCIDHDHITQKYRGVICSACNYMIGLAYNNSETLIAAAEYLR